MNKFISLFDRSIQMILLISVALIILLSCMNIALRWFEVALTFIEPMVRHLVFLSSFLGGVLAIGSDRHIKVDLMKHLIRKNEGLRLVITPIYFLIILLVLIGLSYSSVEFSKSEFLYGKITFLNIHSGYLTAIIPVGFILMTFRHILRLFNRRVS